MKGYNLHFCQNIRKKKEGGGGALRRQEIKKNINNKENPKPPEPY